MKRKGFLASFLAPLAFLRGQSRQCRAVVRFGPVPIQRDGVYFITIQAAEVADLRITVRDPSGTSRWRTIAYDTDYIRTRVELKAGQHVLSSPNPHNTPYIMTVDCDESFRVDN